MPFALHSPDLEGFLILLQRRFAVVILIVVAIGACVSAATLRKRYPVPTTAVLAVAALCLYWGCREMYLGYHLVMLGAEVDRRAEESLATLRSSLSDRRLVRLLSQQKGDANERFYVAVLAAERGLAVSNVFVPRPQFLGSNSYTVSASRLEYPITYLDFAREPRERRHLQRKGASNRTTKRSRELRLRWQTDHPGAKRDQQRPHHQLHPRFGAQRLARRRGRHRRLAGPLA